MIDDDDFVGLAEDCIKICEVQLRPGIEGKNVDDLSNSVHAAIADLEGCVRHFIFVYDGPQPSYLCLVSNRFRSESQTTLAFSYSDVRHQQMCWRISPTGTKTVPWT